ncbi:hypothetical protein CR513_54022, partial [Mucuna pruriens]
MELRDDAISCKLFLGTLRGVAMQWFAGLLPRTIHTFNDLATIFMSQFATNHAKRLEKGLRVDQFSNSLALIRSSNMSEIWAKTEKHIEAKEDQADRIHAEKDTSTSWSKNDRSHHAKTHHR